MKTCCKCGAEKSADHFRPDSRYADGFGSWCRSCHRERGASWAKENRKRLTEKAALARLERPDISRRADRKFKQANKKALAEKHAEWAQRNRWRRNATNAKRKAAKLKATPAWADRDKIAAIYREAERIEAATGVPMNVDHIVPLQSDAVCGLHCEANLQIIPASENQSKKNYWWPDGIEKAVSEPSLPLAEPKPKQQAMMGI